MLLPYFPEIPLMMSIGTIRAMVVFPQSQGRFCICARFQLLHESMADDTSRLKSATPFARSCPFYLPPLLIFKKMGLIWETLGRYLGGTSCHVQTERSILSKRNCNLKPTLIFPLGQMRAYTRNITLQRNLWITGISFLSRTYVYNYLVILCFLHLCWIVKQFVRILCLDYQ